MSQTVQVEGVGPVNFPDDATPQEIEQALNQAYPAKKKSSALGAGLRGFVSGLAPTAGAVGAGELALLGGEALLGAGTGGLGWGAIPLTLAAGAGGGYLAGKGQQKALEALAPKAAAQLQTDVAEHPTASLVGGLASGAPFLKFAPGQIFRRPLQTAIPAAAGAAVAMGQQALEGGPSAPKDLLKTGLEAAAFQSLYGQPRFGRLPLTRKEAAKSIGEKNASKISQTATLHGNVRTQQEPTRTLPQPQGGAGVQPQAKEGIPKEGQQGLLLDQPTTDELERIAIDMGERVDMVPDREPSANEPFGFKAKTGEFMGINPDKGTIEVYPQQYRAWLDTVPEGQQEAAIRARLGEERIHLTVSNDDALAYWRSLSDIERWAEGRAYAGSHAHEFSETNLGHEAIRRRLQQLKGDSSEVIEAAGIEKWSLQSLELLSRVVRNIRETLGTKASAQQNELFERYANGIKAATAVAKNPAAFSPKAKKALEGERELPGMPAPQPIKAAEQPPPTPRPKDTGTSEFAQPFWKPSAEPGHPSATEAGTPPASAAESDIEPGHLWFGEGMAEGESPEANKRRNMSIKGRAIQEIPEDIRHDLPKLRSVLTADARVSGQTVEDTRRLTALVNKKTHRVALVSTFLRGARGETPAEAWLRDPNPQTQRNVALSELSKTWTPIGTFLRSEPARGLVKTYPDVETYQRQFLKPAQELLERRTAGRLTAPVARRRGPEPEGEVEMPPEGSEPFVGPDIEQEAHLEVFGRPDLAAIAGHVIGESGKFESAADVGDSLDALPHDLKAGRPGASATQEAYKKVAYKIAHEHPDWEPEAVRAELTKRIYEAYTQQKAVEQARAGLGLGQAVAPRFPQPTGAPPKAPTETGARELTALPRKPIPTRQPSYRYPQTFPPSPPVEMAADAAARRMMLAKQRGYLGPASRGFLPLDFPASLMQVPKERYTEAPSRKMSLEEIEESGKAQAQESQAQRERILSGEELRHALTQAPPQEYQTRMRFPKGETPAAFSAKLKDQAEGLRAQFKAMVLRGGVKRQIPARVDAATNTARLTAVNAKQEIELASGEDLEAKSGILLSPKDRAQRNAIRTEAKQNRVAFIAAQSAAAEKGGYATLQTQIEAGRRKAERWSNDINPVKRIMARRWSKVLDQYAAAKDAAQARQNDPRFKKTFETANSILADELATENAHGFNVTEAEHYIPGIMEGSFWDGSIWHFAGHRFLGEAFKGPKKFKTPYEAISVGPYFLASLDIGELAQHRIVAGQNGIWRNVVTEQMKALKDPTTNKPLLGQTKPEMESVTIKSPSGEEFVHEQPKAGGKLLPTDTAYRMINAGLGRQLAVLDGYAPLIRALYAPDAVANSTLGKAALTFNAALKHGVVLMWDSFHPGRLLQYSLATTGLRGRKGGYSGGYSALHYLPDQLPQAVKQGYISQEAANWATTNVNIGGRLVPRHQIARDLVSKGMNAVRLTDALYKDAIQNIPVLGGMYHRALAPYNNFLFDRFVPGLMTEAAVRNVEKLSGTSKASYDQIVSDVAKDTNIFYGSMGRQGLFKNPTWRSLAQLMFLAPSWQEALVQKEVRMAGRLTGISAMTGRTPGIGYGGLGMLGESVAKGIVSYLALSQLINLATRGKFTWQNEEPEHKLDAYFHPPGSEKGFWLSPLSTFAEITHDLVRLLETKPKTWDAMEQLGENRLGPTGKAVHVLVTNKSPTGQTYSTLGGTLGGTFGQFAPTPISFGPPAKLLGHAIAPGTVSPPAPGSFFRQVIAASAGLKTQPEQTALNRILAQAQDFARKEGFKKDTGWEEVQTDAPGYTKLRSALRNDDRKEAARNLDALLADHTPEQVQHAMQLWARRPFTGSRAGDRMFLYSLDDAGRELYSAAYEQKLEVLQKFYEALLSR